MTNQAKTNPEIAGTQMTRKEALDTVLKICAKSKQQIARGEFYTLEESWERRMAQRKKFSKGEQMKKLKISKEAECEIDGIYEYLLNNFGTRIADEKIAKIYVTFEILCHDPYMGRSLDRNDQNLRIYVHKPNVIIYDIDNNALEILHVVDARTDYIRRIFPDIENI